MKNLKSYLESRHQNASAYVVKTQKSFVDMLIVDMRRCEKYKESLQKLISLKQALEEEL